MRHFGIDVGQIPLQFSFHVSDISVAEKTEIRDLNYILRHARFVEENSVHIVLEWGCCGESKLNALQKIQNRAARIVTNSPNNAPAAPLLQSLGWLSITDLERRETAMLTALSLNSFATLHLTELFTKCSESNELSLRSSEANLTVLQNFKTARKRGNIILTTDSFFRPTLIIFFHF